MCQRRRLNRLKANCKNIDVLNVKSMDQIDETALKTMTWDFLVDDKHHLILKTIPKTGCNSWRTLFIENNLGNLNFTDYESVKIHAPTFLEKTLDIDSLPSYDKKTILNKLSTYTVAMTVRHPLQRIQSMFMEKSLPARYKAGNAKLDKELILMFENYINNSRITEHTNRHFAPFILSPGIIMPSTK